MIEIVEMIVSLVENYLLEAGLREGERVCEDRSTVLSLDQLNHKNFILLLQELPIP